MHCKVGLFYMLLEHLDQNSHNYILRCQRCNVEFHENLYNVECFTVHRLSRVRILYFSFQQSRWLVYKWFARIQAIANRPPSTVLGANPPKAVPGRMELLVLSPKKYLRGPALVMAQDTARVAAVDRMRTTGKVLRWGTQEAPAAIMTRICWWVR